MMGLSPKRRPPAVLVAAAAVVATSVLMGCREKTKPPAKKPTRATTQPAVAPATQPGNPRSFQLVHPKPGTLLGASLHDSVAKADHVFVGKVLKVDWAGKQASKPTMKEFDLTDWGVAQVQCVTAIRGVKVGQALSVLVYPRHQYSSGGHTPSMLPVWFYHANIWCQAEFTPGSQWLIFAGKDSGDARVLPPKAARISRVLDLARMVTGKEPILAEAKRAVALHALPAGKKFAAFKELLAKGSLDGLAAAYAGKHIRYTNASPIDIARAINTAIQRSATQVVPCQYFLIQVDEMQRQFLGKRKDPKLSATLQTMLLEDAPRFAEASDRLLDAYVRTLLYTFQVDENHRYWIPDAPPKNLAVANKKAVARVLLRMAARMETIWARFHKLASENPATGQFNPQISFHAKAREGLTKLARFLDPTATQPAKRLRAGRR